MRFRQSTLNTWMDCPLKAKFRHIDQLPSKQNAKASFGTVIHHCLDLYEHSSGNVDLAVETFKDLWHNPEKLGVAPEKWPKFTTYGGLRERGIEILREYHEKNKWESRQLIATEKRFLVPFGEHELEGTIDALEVKKSGKGKELLRVKDYKTNSRKPSIVELALNIQFTVYIYATTQREFWVGDGGEFPGVPNGQWMWETLKEMPRRGIWYHLWTNSELDAGGRDQSDFDRLYRLCNEVERAIKAEVFVPNISADSCGWCDYHGPCGVSPPASVAEMAEEDNAWI